LSDSHIEAYFRSEIRAAWSALEATRSNPAAYARAFEHYCRLLLDSDLYRREGRLLHTVAPAND